MCPACRSNTTLSLGGFGLSTDHIVVERCVRWLQSSVQPRANATSQYSSILSVVFLRSKHSNNFFAYSLSKWLTNFSLQLFQVCSSVPIWNVKNLKKLIQAINYKIKKVSFVRTNHFDPSLFRNIGKTPIPWTSKTPFTETIAHSSRPDHTRASSLIHRTFEYWLSAIS